MSTVLLITVWAIAAGYVTAGLLASLYQLLTRNPVSFNLLFVGEMAMTLLAVPLLLLSGPVVIARNAWQGHIVQRRDWGWLAAAGLIVAVWSFLTGVIVLELVFRLFS